MLEVWLLKPNLKSIQSPDSVGRNYVQITNVFSTEEKTKNKTSLQKTKYWQENKKYQANAHGVRAVESQEDQQKRQAAEGVAHAEASVIESQEYQQQHCTAQQICLHRNSSDSDVTNSVSELPNHILGKGYTGWQMAHQFNTY